MLKGLLLDNETRCRHYHSPLDIIAIKFKCCGDFYPCYTCHEELAGHTAITWTAEEQDEKAILCGVCRSELSIRDYLFSGNQCPHCRSAFNPDCSRHYHLYFDT